MLVPRTHQEITAEWLTAALRERGMLVRGAVADVRAEDAGGLRGFAGQVLRLRLAFDGDAADAPISIIAKRPEALEAGARRR